MKRHKKTDKILKDKMENFSMDAPMHLFGGIVDALDAEVASTPSPDPKSGNSNYWLLALLILTIAGGGIWYASSDNTLASSTEKELSVISQDNAEEGKVKASDSFLSGKLVEEENVKNENGNVELTGISFEENSELRTVTEEDFTSNSYFENTNSDSKNPKSNFLGNELITKNNKQSQTNESTFGNTLISKTNQNSNVNLTEKGGEIPKIPTTRGFENNSINSFGEKNNLSDEQEGKTITDDIFEAKKEIINASKIIAANKSVTEDIFILPTLRTAKTSSNNANEVYQLDLDPKCGIKPDGSKIKFTTSIDVFFSPDYASQILEYKTEDFREHAQERTNSESPSFSFNTGVRVNFLTEFDWVFRTGLVYTQINEIFKTQHEETVTTVDVLTGDTLGTQTGLRDVNIRNSYRMIDIPLLIGYESKMKKFKLNINAGAFINLSAEQKGALFSPIVDRVVYFTDGHPEQYDIFRKRIGWSAFVGLGFNIPLNKKLQFIIEPHVRYYPKSFTLKTYKLNQKYVSGGVMIGLRRDL